MAPPDLQIGTEILPHHKDANQEHAALIHFQQEYQSIIGKCSGADEQVKNNFKGFDLNNVNRKLHKEGALDDHLHALGVYKIDGKYDLVIYDDRVKGKAATVDAMSGKVDSTFNLRSSDHHTWLEGHSKAVHETNKGSGVYTDANGITREYDTKGGSKVKVLDVNAEHKNVTIQDNNGNCQAFVWNATKGAYDQKLSDIKSGGWNAGHTYQDVKVSDDGTVTAYVQGGHDTIAFRAVGGQLITRDGHVRSIEDAHGKRSFEWNGDLLNQINIERTDKQPGMNLTRSTDSFSDDAHSFKDQYGRKYRVTCDGKSGALTLVDQQTHRVLKIATDGQETHEDAI